MVTTVECIISRQTSSGYRPRTSGRPSKKSSNPYRSLCGGLSKPRVTTKSCVSSGSSLLHSMRPGILRSKKSLCTWFYTLRARRSRSQGMKRSKHSWGEPFSTMPSAIRPLSQAARLSTSFTTLMVSSRNVSSWNPTRSGTRESTIPSPREASSSNNRRPQLSPAFTLSRMILGPMWPAPLPNRSRIFTPLHFLTIPKMSIMSLSKIIQCSISTQIWSIASSMKRMTSSILRMIRSNQL